MTDLLSTRTNEIRNRITTHVMEDLGCAAVTPSKDTWQQFKLDGPYRFGWAPPFPIEEDSDDLWVVSFAPSILAETTLELDDAELDEYLTMVEAFIDAALAQPKLSPDEVAAMVEHMLYEEAPESLKLLSRVQADAIDKGIVH